MIKKTQEYNKIYRVNTLLSGNNKKSEIYFLRNFIFIKMFLFGYCSSRVCGESTINNKILEKDEALDSKSSKKIIKKLRKASKILQGFKNFEESMGICKNDF